MIQTKNYSLHIAPDGVATWVRLSQNENGRSLIFNVIGDGTITIPSGSTATISGTKPDGVVYSAVGTVSGTQVTITEDVQLTAAAGEWDAKIRITNSGQTVATGRIHFVIDADPVAPGSVPSSSELSGLVAEAEQYAENSHYWADEAAQAAASIDSTWFIDGAKNTDVSTLTTTSKKVAGAINELNSGKLDKTGDAKDATVTFTTGDAADSDVTPTTAWTPVSKLTSGITFKTILEAVSKMFKNIRKHEKLLGATNISSLSTEGTVTAALSKLNTDMMYRIGDTINIARNFLIGYISGDNKLHATVPLPKPANTNTLVADIVLTKLEISQTGAWKDILSTVTAKTGYTRTNAVDMEIQLSAMPSGIVSGTPIIVEFRGSITF